MLNNNYTTTNNNNIIFLAINELYLYYLGTNFTYPRFKNDFNTCFNVYMNAQHNKIHRTEAQAQKNKFFIV